MEILSLQDIEDLKETSELECKLAHGKDGKGRLPHDFWRTYSAFANSHGGIVLLGIKEKSRRFSVSGIEEPEKVIQDLYNTINNRQKVSCNVLSDTSVKQHQFEDGQIVISIQIPMASRKQRPVYLQGNPLGNTYQRIYDGDRVCDDETVKRMLAEQLEDERDNKILKGFSLDDIDLESFHVYRQMLRDSKPQHPWLELEDQDLLERLRCIRTDRETQQRGITLAGILMFGRSESIRDELPHYLIDYQERAEAKTTNRWIDRLVPDGTWSGNLFDFYRKVYRKLTADLKVPFHVESGQRKDDSPIHIAIREALVNAIVHADYTGRVSVLVVKRPDMFGFRNPGRMRIVLDQALRGGESDCRNRILHQMFLMIGAGERAGSGIPKIYSGWKSQSWRPPALYEKDEPEQTLLELRMLDLLPIEIVEKLKSRFGSEFDSLQSLERLILATAAIEGLVTHGRLQEITTDHTHDLTRALQGLVRGAFLESTGKTRGTVYTLPGVAAVTPEDVFAPQAEEILSSAHLEQRSEHLEESSAHLEQRSEHLEESSAHLMNERDRDGCLITDHLESPILDDLSAANPSLLRSLEEKAHEPRSKKRVSKDVMKQTILEVSTDRYLTLTVLATLLNRDPNALRQQHLNGMVKQGEMKLAFPATPNHPQQAYKAT